MWLRACRKRRPTELGAEPQTLHMNLRLQASSGAVLWPKSVGRDFYGGEEPLNRAADLSGWIT